MAGCNAMLALALALVVVSVLAQDLHGGRLPTLDDPVYGSQAPFYGKQICPSKTHNPREWHLNEDKPCDGLFSPGDPIKKHSGGGWEITGEVRMGVLTSLSGNHSHQWRDVELTGQMYVISTDVKTSEGHHFSFYARGGRHTGGGSEESTCDGSAYKGDLDVVKQGDVWTKKEISHPVYSEAKAHKSTGATTKGKWIGWKVVMFNLNNNTVVTQGFLDKDNKDTWEHVYTMNDTGDWQTHKPSAHCLNYLTHKERTDKDVIAWSGPEATFRSDGLHWAFKELSVREICALGDQTKCTAQDHRFTGCDNMKQGKSCAEAKCHASYD